MKLISCENCGIVLDQDRHTLEKSDFYNEDGEVKDHVAVWLGDYYVAILRCPVCKADIETDYKI